MKTNDLEDRIIDFSVLIISICNNLKTNYAANYYGNQLIRSSGSPALNYGAGSRFNTLYFTRLIVNPSRIGNNIVSILGSSFSKVL